MRRSLPIAGALVALAFSTGCFHPHFTMRPTLHPTVRQAVVTPGPPPHAPAHGYRHRHPHHGLELVFDSALGVYAVAGWADHFFYDGYYYRHHGHGWQMSLHIDGGWHGARLERLPKHLDKHAHKRGQKHHGKHRGRGHGPAKHKHHDD